ncbi:MAG: hypothetical protein M1822_008021 [Bathelium mastoideum]|nr:MAG: hypothetical protein M1822_008021 [Bathelium mastoideum]
MVLLDPPSLALAVFATTLLYAVSISCYRLYLCPLASIPGPRLAALTYWYECFYDVWRPAQYVFKIRELHQRYGPIVRITPREISISDPDFLDIIYAPKSGARRDKDLEKVKALGINTSVGGAVQHDLHRRRRESLNPFFSQKSVLNFEPDLDAKVGQLSARVAEAHARKQVVNLSDIHFAFASDVVSQYCFGHNSNALSDTGRAAVMRNNVATTLRSVKFNLHFGWVRDLVRAMPVMIGSRFIPQGIKDMMRIRMKIRQEVKDILDRKDDHAERNLHSIFYELRDSPTLPETEKTVQRLEDEATLLTMAGTESTAKSICIAHHYLLSSPQIMAKLRAELTKLPHVTLAQLMQNTYIHAINMEANRLSFGLTGRQPRVSPDSALAYEDRDCKIVYTIPAGTPLSTSTLLVHANEEIFTSPWTFDPDRWLGPQGRDRSKYMLAFSKGPRMCIGMNLASAELALTIAEMAKWDMRLFETSEDDVKFLHDYHVATPRLDSLGIRATVLSRWQDHA